MRKATDSDLLGPLAAVAIGAMAAFLISFVIWSGQIDNSARSREETLVSRGVNARMVEIETAIYPVSNWDETVANLDRKFDRDWARKNLTAYFEQLADFDGVFALDGQDRPVYASLKGEDAALSAYASFSGASGLVAEVRAAERARGPVTKPDRNKHSKPIQKSAFIREGGIVRLMTASLVQPDFGTVLPNERGAIIVTSLPVDATFLALLTSRFQLEGLKAASQPPSRATVAKAQFDTLGGKPPLILTWTPQRPGAALLRATILPVVLVLVAFSAVACVMIWRVRRATREILATSRAQTEFLANMSHELRTPLNGVVGLSAALEMTPLSERQTEIVKVIKSSGEALEHLLSDVLDLASIETGAIDVRSEPFSPADTLTAAVALYAQRASVKGISLTVEIDPSANGDVLGDAIRVKQVLINILDNAVKFTSVGGVAVSLEREAETGLRVVITDTGIGFAPSQASKIFRRFHQADGSITRQYGGAGLGLSISHQLVTLMGGTITATSTRGQGSVFTVILPLPVSEAPSDKAATGQVASAELTPDGADKGQGDPIRILLSDDHPTNRQVVQALLADAGVDLISTENGLEACEAFERGGVSVVLMDMQMPVMDGLSAIRRIREHEAQSGAPRAFIIMLTANALPEHREASFAAGADLHVPKPIQAERLFAALNQAFEPASDVDEAA